MRQHHLKQLSVNHWATDNRERSLYNSLAKTYAEEAIFAALKSGFDRGVVMADKLPEFMGDNVFDFLQPLFRLWQERGLVELNERSATLTLAGSFWAVSLAQACIQILSSEYQSAHQTRAIAQ